MTINLDTLRKIAEAATPGPWEMREGNPQMDGRNFTLRVRDQAGIRMSTHCYGFNGDPEFIATFDPPTMLALITRLEQAEQDRVKLRNRLDAMRRQRDGYRNQLRKAEQQIQRVREVVGEDSPSFFTNEAMHAYVKAMSEVTRALDGEPNE